MHSTDAGIISDNVTSIGTAAFYGCNTFTKVVVPDNVTVGDEAFRSCKGVTEVIIGDNCTIGSYAFRDCAAVESVEIGEGTTVSQGTLYGCTGVRTVVIGNNAIIEAKVFTPCTNLENVTIGHGAQIGEQAFEGCSVLSAVTINPGCYIGNKAFAGCSTELTTNIAEGYFELGNSVFTVGPLSGNIADVYYADENGVIYRLVSIENGDSWAYVIYTPADTVAKAYLPSEDGTVAEKYEVRNIAAIGDNSEWVISVADEEYTLTISMTGNMPNYTRAGANRAPWHEYAGLIDYVVINGDLTRIGNYAFLNCTEIKSVTMPSTVKAIGIYAFNGCSSLTNIAIPKDVQSIGNYAFQNCTGLVSVDLPNAVATIGSFAFQNCTSLKSVNIPENVTAINNYVFSGCTSLEEVTLPANLIDIRSYAFSGCTSLEEVTLPANLIDIGSYAFSECSSLESIVIPAATESIGMDAFWCCTNLKNVVLSEGLQVIDDEAFAGCESLESITIPSTVEYLGAYTFAECTKLKDVMIQEGVLYIGEGAFQGCTNIQTISLPGSIIAVEGELLSGCKKLTTVSLGEGITTIGANAFESCEKLEVITMPESMTSIGASAFRNCSSLTAIEIPDGVTSIGKYAFSGTGLEHVTIPGGVTVIEDYTFCECAGLKNVELGENTTAIGAYAFQNCTSLTEITIPESIISIGKYAFSNTGLLRVTIPAGVTAIEDYMFSDCKMLENVELGEGVTSIGASAFRNCSSLTEVVIPDSVTSIGSYAFSSSGLTSVTIPDSVNNIQSYTFYGCTALQEVTLGSQVESIAACAFANDINLKTIVLNSSKLSAVASNAFSGTSIEEVLVETGVDILYPALFTGLRTMSPAVKFAGPNYFEISDTFTNLADLGEIGKYLEAGEAYYVDEQGMVYRIVDVAQTIDGIETVTQEAHLVYCPPMESTEAVVHDFISSEDGQKSYPVTTICTNAFECADGLTKLEFENPEMIKRLEDLALANCPTLKEINGNNTSSEVLAMFSKADVGVLVLFGTGLDKGTSVQTPLELSSASGGTPWARISTAEFDCLTGHGVDTNIYFTNPDKVDPGQPALRVYFAFSEPDGVFGHSIGDRIEYVFTSKNEKNPDGTPVKYSVYVKAVHIEGTNTYYMEIPAIKSSDTIVLSVNNYYSSPNSDGGSVTIWAEDMTTTATQYGNNVDTYHVVNWRTQRHEFKVEKADGGSAQLYGNGQEDGAIAVQGLSYAISMADTGKVTNKDDGRDFMRSIDFIDELSLNEDLYWDEDVLNAIDSGNWKYRTYTEKVGAATVYGYEWYCIIDGKEIIICKLNKQKGISNLKLYLEKESGPAEEQPDGETEDGANKDTTIQNSEKAKLCVGWTYTNSAVASTEMPGQKYSLAIGNNIIKVKGDVAIDDTFEVTNKIHTQQHFCYSGSFLVDGNEVTSVVKAYQAKPEIEKSYRSQMAYMGEYYPYTIKVANYCAEKLEFMNQVVDPLVADLYITGDNMGTMFESDFGGKYLSIVIEDATLYDMEVFNKKITGTVTGTDWAEHERLVQNTSSMTVYHDKEWAEEAGCINMNTARDDAYTWKIQIGWYNDECIEVTVYDGVNDTPYRREVLAAGDFDIQAVLDRIGYFVTPEAKYTVTWDFDKQGVLYSGEIQQYLIRSTIKDTSMSISWDYEYCVLYDNAGSIADSFAMGGNNAILYYAYPKEQDKEVSINASTESSEVRWDFSLRDEVYLNGEKVSSTQVLEAGSVLDYILTVRHRGNTYHEIVPLVHKLTGAQIVMVSATQNKHLADRELTPKTIGGIDYYLLDKPGVYEDVYVGGYLADRIVVEEQGSYGLYTLMYWYLADISGYQDIAVDVKVVTLPRKIDYEILSYSINNEVWLNDHQTHRLWDALGGSTAFLTFDKAIVLERNDADPTQDVLDKDDYDLITRGETVTYRLSLTGSINGILEDNKRTFTLPASKLYDLLPQGVPEFAAVTDIDFEYKKDDAVIVVKNEDSFDVIEYADGEYRLMGATAEDNAGNPAFEITYKASTTVYIYVTVQYPDGDMWDKYTDQYASERIENTFHVSGDETSVYHLLQRNAVAQLVKGVNSTGIYVEVKDTAEDIYNDLYYPSTNENSCKVYANDDSAKRVVSYYVALYNEGRTRLYLDTIYDKLPAGFTFNDNDGQRIIYDEVLEGVGHTLANIEYSDVQYVQAYVTVDTETEGQLKFTVTDGVAEGVHAADTEGLIHYDDYFERYYLLPGEALVFGYLCNTNQAENTEVRSINTVAMPYFNYNESGFEIGETGITGYTNGNVLNNDGDCFDMTNVEAMQNGFTDESSNTVWLAASVELMRNEIIPGIFKQVADVTTKLGDSRGIVSHALYDDTVTWAIEATNSGSQPIRDYTLTDVIQHDFSIVGDVVYTLYSGSDFGDYEKKITETLFNVEKLNELTPNEDGSYTIQTKNFGEIIVSYSPWFESQGEAEGEEVDHDALLSITFTSDRAAIQESGRGVLNISTLLATTEQGGDRESTEYVNTCYITPNKQDWTDADEGQIVTYNGLKSVQNEATIMVSNFYITTSDKRVEEIGSAMVNKVSAYDRKNYIVLENEGNTFRYTLEVSNPVGETSKVMSNLVLIDTLPEVGDTSVINSAISRDSEFKVMLTENPDFAVRIVNGNTVTNPGFTVQFSTASSGFAAEDWTGGKADINWMSWEEAGKQIDQIRSIRIIIDGVIPSGSTVEASFEAKVCTQISPDDENAPMPGELAWNSFGYGYLITENGISVPLQAAPAKVGIKYEGVPMLVKYLQTPDGTAYVAEQDEAFSYLIYKIRDDVKLNLSDLTQEQIAVELARADMEFTVVQLNVAKGSSTSGTVALNALYLYTASEDGTWHTDGTTEWEWTDEAQYVFVELPIENSDDYAFGRLGGVGNNGYVYTHDATQVRTISSVNVRRLWDIQIVKLSDDKRPIYLEGAWFGLYSKVAPAEEVKLADNLAITKNLRYYTDRDNDLYETYVLHGGTTITDPAGAVYYLIGVQQTDPNGYINWIDLEEETYLVVELLPPAGYHVNDEIEICDRSVIRSVYSNVVQRIVYNSCDYLLPESGSTGKNSYMHLGAAIMLAAGGAIVMTGKRRKRKSGNVQE